MNESSDLRSSPVRDESRNRFPNVNAVENQGTAYRPLDLGRYVGKGLELGRCPGTVSPALESEVLRVISPSTASIAGCSMSLRQLLC